MSTVRVRSPAFKQYSLKRFPENGFSHQGVDCYMNISPLTEEYVAATALPIN